MRWNKKNRQDFLWKIAANRKTIMPTERLKRQATIFDEEITKQEFYHLEFVLFYPDVENKSTYLMDGERIPNVDPVPKQSFQHYLAPSGEVIGKGFKGEPLYKQFIKGYQPAKIKGVTDSLEDQINNRMRDEYPDFQMFTKDIHITRLELIHHVPATMGKRDLEELRRGDVIFFKHTLPDVDNLQKMVFDAMKNTNIMKDDGQVASINGLFKCYGLSPGAIVELEGRL